MFRNTLAVVILGVLLGGCASGVQREAEPGGVAGQKGAAIPVSAVGISLSANAQKLVKDNPKFSQEQLRATVQKALQAKGLIQAAGPRAEITVSEFRVRGTAAAVMLGALAGSDNVVGEVLVRDAAGKQLRKFTVNASYSLGGVAGGDDTRLGWLYDKFAELTVAELSGDRK